MSETNEHNLENDHHPDRHHHDHSSNSNNPLLQAKHGAWGDSISFLSNEHIQFVFQNVNGLSTSPGIHESMKSQMVALQSTMSAFAETNINWKILPSEIVRKHFFNVAITLSSSPTLHVTKATTEHYNAVALVWCVSTGWEQNFWKREVTSH